MHVSIFEFDWSNAEQLTYEEALERLVREFEGLLIEVSVLVGDGTPACVFAGTLKSVHAYDDASPPSIAVDFDTGVAVLERDGFERAAWAVQPCDARGVARALRFTAADYTVEFEEV